MEILKFKTNLSDQQHEAVGQQLSQLAAISQWNIEEGILSLSGSDVDPQEIIELIEKLNGSAELLRVQGISGSDM
ncbi:hypothetical protein BWI97_25665 [Siphonobacter sp. BAB-5405]|uniref:hypothetical protein n=1 Tax=Siphonobacter sp. BAB-5405 TaxID=1864825 RepID=UPI000C806D74|nr:hypothetical protein [Siphonobacter sp. BAB-5405]PMD87610.1 hypothetical protein BWI97_25665 [Siphonobacter sp. BAB-5405]